MQNKRKDEFYSDALLPLGICAGGGLLFLTLLAILCSESGADGNANLLQIAWKLTGKIGSGSVSISEVHLNAGEIEVDVQTEQVQISFTVKANIYDINADGVVSLLDMTRAQRYFGEDYPEADLNGDHTVDVQDLILILMNFTA